MAFSIFHYIDVLLIAYNPDNISKKITSRTQTFVFGLLETGTLSGYIGW